MPIRTPGTSGTLDVVSLPRQDRGAGAGGHTADFERQQLGMAESALGFAGFLGGSLLRSYSHPAKYVVTSSFESVEAVWAFGKSDVFTSAMKSEPVGAVTLTQQESYELAREVVAEPRPEVGCEILIDEVLKGAWRDPRIRGHPRPAL